MDRRAFVRTAARASAVLAGGGGLRSFVMDGAQEVLRIGLVIPEGDAAAASMARGAKMGVEEAAHAAGLMAHRIALVTWEGPGPALLEAVAGAAREGGVAAVIGGWDAASCDALADAAESAGVPFVDAGCTSDALRARCRPHVFHVLPGDAMRAAALAARPADAAEATAAVAWHPSLERYGAGQLNDRFRARYPGEAMDGPAWAGWMAVKVLWEASLRVRSTQPAAVRDYLPREGTQFDGHKGWPLSFRAGDHQLRQPLYLVAPGEGGATRVAGEVPARPAEGGVSSRALLDALAGPSACAG